MQEDPTIIMEVTTAATMDITVRIITDIRGIITIMATAQDIMCRPAMDITGIAATTPGRGITDILGTMPMAAIIRRSDHR